jgi:hypothetical protein
MGEGERHVAADVERALLPDQVAEQAGKGGQRAGTRTGREAMANRMSPPRNIGTERS